MTIRVGINGFGRIGRCVARLCAAAPDMNLVAVNDILDDPHNLVYLYNYDSTYGRAPNAAKASPDAKSMIVDGTEARIYHEREIDRVPWNEQDVDVVVDSSGVRSNVDGCQRLVTAETVKRAVVTHLPSGGIDRCLIMGVNHDEFDPVTDRVVSSSICDANAIAHVLVVLDREFGIESGCITTLHPWLSYQNLVDKPLISQSQPGHFWRDYSLGRASIGTLIPKNTTAVTALTSVIPEIAGRLVGFSYRVPTHIIASADMTIRLKRHGTRDAVVAAFKDLADSSKYVALNFESLTALDYLATPWSAIVDMQWISCHHDLVKVVLWYDNEWGYSNRVADVIRHVAR